MTGPIKPKKTQRTSVGGRFGESGRSARLAATKRGDPRDGRAARAQRTTDQTGEYMSRDQLGRDTIDPESLKVALGTPSSGSGIPGGVGTGSTTVSVTKTTVVESDVNVFVDGNLIGSRDGIDIVAGTNVTLAAVDDASNSKVSVTISASGGGSGISDGDYGDITVSGGGAALTIDADSVTFAKMQNIATDRLIGRVTAGTGDPEVLETTQALDWIGSTQGDVLFRGGTKWAILSPGTPGQVMTTGGAAANPSWQPLLTEVEIDFGSTPVHEKTFTVSDARVTGSRLVSVSPSGNAPTGLTSDEWLWDAIGFAALPGSGSFTLYAHAEPGPVSGKRKIVYQVS